MNKVKKVDQLEAVINNDKNLLPSLKKVAEKIYSGERITPEEGILLFKKGEIGFLGSLANFVREKLHGDRTYFNRNIHIEPTNVCVYSCQFCSYSRLYKNRDQGWELSLEDMMNIVRSYDGKPITEVHIVGGVHPRLDMEFFVELLRQIKKHRPELHIKGFTAVELCYMFKKAKVSTREGLQIMHEAGLDSLPGGGAEIFDPEIRQQICADKVDAAGWLDIHATAHQLGMPTNATMLYGHIEKYHHRIDHMEQLRQLQDCTKGFNTFIPLKFRNSNNDMSHVPEISVIEDIKMYAVARLFMDNFPHLKAYWPMLGRGNAQLMLSYGVDDIDGTIDDSTKIYSMAGAEEQHPKMTTEEIVTLIKQAGRHPIERDTLYNEVRDFTVAEIG